MIHLAIVACAISALGQILLKLAMNKHGAIQFTLSGLINLLSEPVLIIALMMHVVALIIWLQVLSKIPLSTAYPILAITYVIVPVLSVLFLKESIQQSQLIGMFLVLVGVIMIGRVA
jgi:multidrug transporter EmrE-like cation transporter